MPDPEPRKRLCFVVGPIGPSTSDTRDKADWVLEGIIKPALTGDPFQYEVVRADEVTIPGQITSQIINHVLDADLVVADLTGGNANAFYELGVRHTIEKPTIHLFEKGADLPFDVKDYRSVPYSVARPSDISEAIDALRRHAKAVEQPGFRVSNPITQARGHVQLQQSADPRDKIVADLQSTVEELSSRLRLLEERADPMRGLRAVNLVSGDRPPESPFFRRNPSFTVAVPSRFTEGLSAREKADFTRIVAEAIGGRDHEFLDAELEAIRKRVLQKQKR